MPTNPFDITAPQSQAAQVNPVAPIAAPQAAQTQQAAPTQQAVTRAGEASLATARQAAVDPATQTVQGQLAGILASGNPLLVQAQTRAKQEANKRGLLNSSMAVGAGESALYDAALPIASQDAETFSRFGLSNVEREQQAELANAAARNEMEQLNVSEAGATSRFNVGEAGATGRFNVGEANVAARQAADLQAQTATQNAQLQQQTALENAQLQQQTALENARLQQQAAAGNQDAQTKLALQQLDADTRVEMTNIEANYRTLMQASQSASDLYQQTLKNMSDIVANKDMSAEAKNAAIAQQKDFLRNGMNLIGAMNNLGIDELVNFGAGEPTPGTEQPVPPAQVPGDSNGDGRVDYQDIESAGA